MENKTDMTINNKDKETNKKKDYSISRLLAIISLSLYTLSVILFLMLISIFQVGFGNMGLIIAIIFIILLIPIYIQFRAIREIKQGKIESAFIKLLITNIILFVFFAGFLIGPICGIISAILLKKKN